MNEFITNGQDIKNRIIQEIRNASESIYVAMMLFTDRDIAQAIINAKKRGVLVEIIFSSHEKNRKVRKMFQKAKIPVFSFQSEDYRGKMKHRFCLIDGNTSLSGSYNYTALASKNSIEDLQITDDKNTYYHYLQEFTRLKNLIDQNINLNDIEEIQAPPSPVETFTKLVQGLVFASAEIDLQKYNDRGYECAKESKGNIDVYWTEYHNIREDIKSLATDNRLGSTKNTLINNLNNAFQIKKNELKEEKDKQQRYVEQKFARKKDQINDRILSIKKDKLKLEIGNDTTKEKGLYQINSEIENLQHDITELEPTFPTIKFLNWGTGLSIAAIVILGIYLMIFFSSAMYKLLYESSVIEESIKRSSPMDKTVLVDPNAMMMLFEDFGTLAGLMSISFFLIPVLLSNLHVFRVKKWVEILFIIIGICVFDFIVAYKVAANQKWIEGRKLGKHLEVEFSEIWSDSNFWVIFIFGMFPLLALHFLIAYIVKCYRNSQRDIVDHDRSKKVKKLKIQLNKFKSDKDQLTRKLLELDTSIKSFEEQVEKLNLDLDKEIEWIEEKYSQLTTQIMDIYSLYHSNIQSGQIFNIEIFDRAIAAFKSGFTEFLSIYYSEAETANRLKLIEEREPMTV